MNLVTDLNCLARPADSEDARDRVTLDQPGFAVVERHLPIDVGIGPVEFGDGATHLYEIVELEIRPGVVGMAHVSDQRQPG